jgi:hypothetical protein
MTSTERSITQMFSHIRNERGSWTLVGLLVAVAVGMVVVFFFELVGVWLNTKILNLILKI